jgi:hypothetical protein
MINDKRTGKYLEGDSCDLIEVLSLYLPEATEEDNENVVIADS